ncbi:unnamed protein product [Protopolystoma xenopodis]|uniref:Uncharacterized protein n=1 Tax=Protopolystoma xenopodis TaxID=117903 RepID=A0A3S5CK27_9PLAT|nr:unnamed protein product [Protopolystoma xenopodis]
MAEEHRFLQTSACELTDRYYQVLVSDTPTESSQLANVVRAWAGSLGQAGTCGCDTVNYPFPSCQPKCPRKDVRRDDSCSALPTERGYLICKGQRIKC